MFYLQYIHVMYNECKVYRFTCVCESTSIHIVCMHIAQSHTYKWCITNVHCTDVPVFVNIRVYSMHAQYIHVMYNECTAYRFTCISEYTSIQYAYTIQYIHVMYNECKVYRFTWICEYTSIQYVYTIHYTYTWCKTNVQYVYTIQSYT